MARKQNWQFTVVLLASVAWSAPERGATQQGESPEQCALNCSELDKRQALVLEYELCSAHEALRTAVEQKRVMHEGAAGIALPEESACWKRRGLAGTRSGQASDSLTHVVVPASSQLRLSPEQSMSFDFAPLRACLGPRRAKGLPPAHRDITFDALKAHSLAPSTGKNLLSLASEQADAFLWTKPHAHAQTPDDGDPATAQRRFRDYLRKISRMTRSACCRNDPRAAGYLLGYILHAVQDLATHRGMTNLFHSYEMSRGNNPDWVYESRLQDALNWSVDVIGAMKATNGTCLKDAAKLEPPSSDEGWDALAERFSKGREPLLGKRDGGLTQMMAFLVPGYFASKPKRIDWFKDEPRADFKSLVLDVVSAELSKACPAAS